LTENRFVNRADHWALKRARNQRADESRQEDQADDDPLPHWSCQQNE
jgi:hypothetical protein